jgi:hypothetical protein
MIKGQEHDWHIELAHIRAQLSYAVDNLDSISKRHEVALKLENVLYRIHELCELTKEEVNED